ncbi:hypothetical protein PF008_g27736 [Phytophthora fragariae]|uniref:M96 mating-specific protein family n=1 Tax=Phytophthora fragariae TaxID=53985 RepID=A0A6G0QDH2_9STRA|nr:hypothetical protein PF008_g27736 [Phytophthora fragariae]
MIVALASLDDDEWDPDALLEALDVDIGDFGLALDTCVDSDAIPSATSCAASGFCPLQSEKIQIKPTTKVKRNYDPNKARSEQLRELRRLRTEADALQLQLQQLQTKRAASNCSVEHQTGHHSDAGLPKVWQDICARQLERRLKAEQENSRLRSKCRTELKMAKSVEKLLFKRLSLQPSEPETGKCVRRVEIPAGFIKHVAARIFDELAAGVDVSYRGMERVLETNCPVPTGMETPRPMLREGISFELFDRRVLPFDLHATGDAWWRRWQNYRGQRSDETAGDRVVRERCGLEMVDVKTGRCATFYVQQVLRQYVEDHRVAVVWHAYFEPFTFDQELVRGVHFLLKGCVLMKPHRSDDAEEVATSVLTCYNITPHFSDPEIQKDDKTVALTKFVVSATSASISTSNEMMENLLVDQALRKCY